MLVLWPRHRSGRIFIECVLDIRADGGAMQIPLSKSAAGVVHVDGVLLAVLLTSLTMNVYLGLSRARTTSAVVADHSEVLKAGSQAPLFEALDLNGSPVDLKYGADRRNTLLYVFSPTCHWCE